MFTFSHKKRGRIVQLLCFHWSNQGIDALDFLYLLMTLNISNRFAEIISQIFSHSAKSDV